MSSAGPGAKPTQCTSAFDRTHFDRILIERIIPRLNPPSLPPILLQKTTAFQQLVHRVCSTQMWPFQRNRLDDRFEKVIRELREEMDQVRRIARNCDADVSAAIEKMNRLAGRLAKRTRDDVPPPLVSGQDGPPGPLVDPISANILARRARQPRKLSEEIDDGVLPGR